MLRRNAGDEVDGGGYHWPMGAQPVNGSYTGRGEEGMKCIIAAKAGNAIRKRGEETPRKARRSNIVIHDDRENELLGGCL